MDLLDLDRRALDLQDAIVRRISPTDLDRTTPCTEWNLGELLCHLVGENNAFAVAATDGEADDWEAGSLGDDPYRAFADSAAAVTKAFAADGMLDREMVVREFGTFPGRVAVSMHLVDTVVHGWDLARSLGVSYEPDDELVRAALGIAEQVPDTPEARGADAVFARAVSVPADAPALERLVAHLGRSPA